MLQMPRTLLAATLATTALTSPAAAATFLFDVVYDGTTTSLAAGSDDPLASTMLAGDSFTYIFRAAPGYGWRTIASDTVFPFLAFPLAQGGTRTVDYTLNFNRAGVTAYSFGETGAQESAVHVGSNVVPIVPGIVFDELNLAATITAATAPSTPTSLLPFAPPEQQSGAINFITLSPVPEPESWTVFIIGFGAIGAAMRRWRLSTTARYAA